ncbi:cytochrome P450 family [Rhizoctonia solani]|uniref:Cytochrome P450 family n=1 Tax=Rhizoctonia solani TaxID=456999 RepID=A0A8H7H5C1_9AGAM|nr:cytochrome P450 family [Rhizoctonia solani]
MVREPSLPAWGDFASLVAVTAHHKYQEHSARKLIQRLLEHHQKVLSTHKLENELFLSISATLLRSIYGYEAVASDDCCPVETQAIFSFMTNSLLTSSYLVNIIPVLKYAPEWLPGAGWKRDAIKWRKGKDTLIKDISKLIQSTDESSQIIFGSLRTQTLSIGLTDKEAEDYVDQIAITMFAGETDTNVNTLLMFFMAMVLYPSVQKKAHDEIDLVLGHSRLSKVEDQAQLNYIDRIVQETLRWAPVTPIAFPHTCFWDDVYKGHRIPKGAIVAMTRDETVYKNAEAFDPDRFLNSTTLPSPLFGRCPGVHFAQSSLFITIASILMAFDIRATKDGNGQDILPSGKMTSSAVLTPEHVEFELTPRSEKHKELARNGL